MKWVLLKFIRAYQKWISPLFPARCRFYPTCSAYAVGCLEIFGFFKAIKKITQRLLKCHPWHPGGIDPVMEAAWAEKKTLHPNTTFVRNPRHSKG